MQALSRRKLKAMVLDVNVSLSQRQYVREYLKKQKKISIIQTAIFVIFVALWEIGARAGFIDAFIFSSPSRVIESIYNMSKEGTLFYHFGITLSETLLSFVFVNVFGTAIAILLWWNHSVSKVLEPYLVVLNSLPKSALAPVFIVWLGNNMKTIIIAAISVSVFGTIITLYSDFKSVEEDKIKLIRTLGGSKREVLWKVVLPSNIPAMISLMKVNIGLSLVGVIIGEFLAAKAGLGYLIIYGSQVFKLDWVIMSIILLCILATVLYKGLGWLETRYGEHV
ncbi:ABC transporter permease [[Clostridium] polysaccharolyticum]|uniref:NitT/TauT family transport system permease protein n=1 Tax=[Clostridium] polysaccharolyticum TaxID=29364 RepID=A0A1I0DWL4_9FIRM|nr:ABC transporter permease [[Clostridium] polysaccharolyticum]SET37020.1 NitT/TauT family transport system permease protein [[Clostridium] polysaccharolyticum]